MKTSLNWLNSYLDRPLSVEEAAKLFTELGFPTESWEPVGGDWAMEVEVTSNRPDLLSHVGLAREAAAASGRELRGPAVGLEGVKVAGKAELFASVRCEDAAMCPLYTARVIRGVKIGPSPKWLVERLESVGLRSVNNVVDVTNFVMLELGQPLHAFDLAKLSGHAIVVRRAKKDEPFTAIDQSKHKLVESMLVIADADKPVALAGVMGGLESEVSGGTKEVLLESAVFDPLSVRKASRALRLMSDSSYRFERGVDVAGVERSSRRAARLIAELAGGELAEGVIRVGVGDPAARRVTMRVARCQGLTGVDPRDLPAGRMVELLGKIGVCPVLEDGGKVVACSAPSHRMDLEREVDLIEEVIRLYGLEHVPMRERIEIAARPAPVSLAARGQLRQVLTAHGYYETVTFSFVAPKQGRAFLPAGTSGVMVDDDRRKAEPMLRPSLLPSLLTCRKANQDAGNREVRLFETSATWIRQGDEKGAIIETPRLAMLADAPGASGAAGEAVRELRGVIDELQTSLAGTQTLTYEPATRANLSAAAEIRRGGKVLGFLGVLDAATQGLFDLQTPVVVAELDLDVLLEKYPPPRKVMELPRYPAVERDLSVIVEETVTWQAIEGVVVGLGVTWLESVGFVGVYRGKPIESGRKSVTLRMVFRDPNGTLRHEQVDEQVRRVVEALGAKVGASLRA
ncbi:MAG: phenylalanine--tRNA ligase subunit beta [Phycisphaeraceae bacterium]|nr:phenylalanine--tRNA ligase subunit beta [Phycisphaeraceae bacterium]